jgi:hypothetical protein
LHSSPLLSLGLSVESSQRGIARVNVSGYLLWCWVYAAIFLPLSYPLTRLLQRGIQRLLQRGIQRLSRATGNAS